MKLSVTIQQLKDFLRKDNPKDLENIDRLFGFTMIMLPVIFGPPALPLLALLTTKNELVKIVKGVIEALTSKKEEETIKEYERMKIAYGLIVYSSFIESLSENLPEDIIAQLNRIRNDENNLTLSESKGKSQFPGKLDIALENDKLQTWPIPFPHPMESISDQKIHLKELYDQMSAGFCDFLISNISEDEAETELLKIKANLSSATEQALKYFDLKYFELCSTYEKFAIWSNIQLHKASERETSQLTQQVKQYIELSDAYRNSLDIGFSKIRAIIDSLPETIKTIQAEEIVSSLSRHYQARINEPIIDASDGDDDKTSLSFPLVKDAFIPQSYRYLRYSVKIKRLEDEALWSGLERRNDLGLFIINYLSSPYSLDAPLIILGHPGSGKSLLTTMIAANFVSGHYTTIKVPLREVDSEIGIVGQIEEQIARITNIKIDSWAKVSASFANAPLIIILDGYDELLQASGRVFAGYLRDVQSFQKSEFEQGRPVRVIITSRITLIDKAVIPTGATIVRLLEFDRSQTEQWISIWNLHNTSFFHQNKTYEFELPPAESESAEKILSLAEQPLLLLMLAIYDSEDNKLRGSISLDRTVLYDSLLRRFIYREKSKVKSFRDSTEEEMKVEIDNEMQRLAVAAIGMYNRRKLHILSHELNEDIKFFDLERNVKVASGRPMTQADLLLGSFFFIHRSKPGHTAGSSDGPEEVSAFEFLHNTFGEFLTADFIIRQAIKEVDILREYRNNPKLSGQRDRQLTDADGFSREWFVSHIYTPLFSRPVVLEMIREWMRHSLYKAEILEDDFMLEFDLITTTQIQRLLTQREMPAIMRKEAVKDGHGAPFGDHPLLGHIAIYSINLITLRALLDSQSFVFLDTRYVENESSQPWNQLVNIWKSWFGLEGLQGITAILTAKRLGDRTIVATKETFQVSHDSNRLETFYNVNLALGDNISALASGVALIESNMGSDKVLETVFEMIESENLLKSLYFYKEKIANFSNRSSGHRTRFNSYLRVIFPSLFERVQYDSNQFTRNYQNAMLLTIVRQSLNSKRDSSGGMLLLREITEVLNMMVRHRMHETEQRQFIIECIRVVNDFLYEKEITLKPLFFRHSGLSHLTLRFLEIRPAGLDHPAVLEFLLLTHNDKRDKYLFEIFKGPSRKKTRDYFFQILLRRPLVIDRFLSSHRSSRGSQTFLRAIFEMLDPDTLGKEEVKNLNSLTFGVYRALRYLAEKSENIEVKTIMARIDDYLMMDKSQS